MKEFLHNSDANPHPEPSARIRDELQQLRAELDDWVDQTAQDLDKMPVSLLAMGDDAAEGMNHAQLALHNAHVLQTALQEERAIRTALAMELVATWREHGPLPHRLCSGEQRRGVRLDLAFRKCHRLPTLSVRLNDVVELSMQGFRLTEQDSLNSFIQSFPNLEVLSLESVDLRHFSEDDHEGCSLPPAICQLRHLSSLNLRSTQLEFSERAASQLTNLLRLQNLDLSDNPLGIPPMVWGMNNLRRLNLRNTRITRCPDGIMDKPYLTLLDLRDNQITRIPQAVLNQAIARDRVLLWNNPLTDEDTLRRLIAHREQTAINLWSREPGTAFASLAQWLNVTDSGPRDMRLQTWQHLALKPGGAKFSEIIGTLMLTPDFQVNFLDLQARVWRLLMEAGASDELWGQLILNAPLPIVVFDNPLAAFTALEERAQPYRHAGVNAGNEKVLFPSGCSELS